MQQVLLAGLSAAQHSQETIRELAYMLVLALAKHQSHLFEPVLDVVLQPLLQGCADESREVGGSSCLCSCHCLAIIIIIGQVQSVQVNKCHSCCAASPYVLSPLCYTNKVYGSAHHNASYTRQRCALQFLLSF